MKELTKAEEEIMLILWKLKNAFVKDIIKEMDNPKPAYNTVSTIVRILEQKGMVAYTVFGKSHQYYPLISKEDYSQHKMNGLLQSYFSGSFSNMISFFAKENNLNTNDLDELLKIIDKKHKS